jgi:hypothetical protein
MDAFERDMVKLQMENHNRVREGFRSKCPQIASFILSNMADSSIKRVKDIDRPQFELAIRDNDIPGLLERIRVAHIFRGRAAGASEIQTAIAEATGFQWRSPETLAEFKSRWDILIDRKFVNLGIPDDMFPRELRVVAFTRALGRYGHSVAVRNACVEYLSRVDIDDTLTVGNIYTDLTLRESGEKLIADDGPKVVNAASTISSKIRGDSKKRPKNGKGKKSSSSEDSKKTPNPKTKEYVDRKVRESNGTLTAAEVYKSIECTGCKKKGHIRPDCRSVDAKDKDKKQSERTGKKTKGPAAGSMFQSVVDDEVDDIEITDPYGAFSSTISYSKKLRHPDRQLISLDSHANISVFNNRDYLTNLRCINPPLKVEGINGSTVTYKSVGSHPLVGTVIYDPHNKYNILSQSQLRNNGYLLRISDDNSVTSVIDKGTSVIRAEFNLDHRDGFYKYNPQPPLSVYNGSLIGTEYNRSEKLKLLTNDQLERAERAIALHNALGHPGDEAMNAMLNSPSLINCEVTSGDLRNGRLIQGPCPICLQARPLPVIGRYPTYSKDEDVQVGQHIRADMVFVNKTPYLFTSDARSRFYSLVRLVNQSSVAMQSGLETIFNFYKGHLKVTQIVTSDYGSVFLALRDWLQRSHQVTLNPMIPGEHERALERGVRDVRQAIRAITIELPYRLPGMLVPYLAFHAVDTRNFIPNAMSAPLCPMEMVTGQRINYRTDILVSFGQLVLTQSKKAIGNSTLPVNEIGLALGRCVNTKGSVWVYLQGSSKPVPRRPLQIVPMTTGWIDHLNNLADLKPSNPATYFEFREGLAAGPDDFEDQEVIVPRRQAVSLPGPDVTPLVVEGTHPVASRSVEPGTVSTGIEPQPSAPVAPITTQQSVEVPRAETPTQSAVAEQRSPPVHLSPPRPPREVVPDTDHASPIRQLNSDIDVNNIITGRRVRRTNTRYAQDYAMNMILSACTTSGGAEHEQADRESLLDLVLEPEVSTEFTVCQVRLAEALKTQYKSEVEKATIKEISSIIRLKTWRYLRTIEDRQPSHHPAVLPCDMFVRDKRDSNGQLLLYKSRLAVGGHKTLEEGYAPFDKTSPTANIEAVYAFLAVAQCRRFRVESADVPTAYLNAPIPAGRRHCMKVSKLISKYVCEVDARARPYLQPDGTLLVELQRALYGLPESGKLWHEHICGLLRRIGYEQKPGDTCQWRYVEVNRATGSTLGVSFLLLYVDDFLHVYGGPQGEKVRDRLHEKLCKCGLPQLVVHKLTPQSPISFLGLSIAIISNGRFHVSQPGYIAALLENFPVQSTNELRIKDSPLPCNFSSRSAKGEGSTPLNETGRRAYLKWVQSLAWTLRTRPDIACAVTMKQTCCTAPTEFDWKDLEHIAGYLKSSPTRGMVLDIDSVEHMATNVDCGFGVHSDRKSHSGDVTRLGKEKKSAISWGSSKHKSVTDSSTSGELVTVSDKADKPLYLISQLEFLLVKVIKPVPIMQDNTSTITIAYLGRPSLHSRRRYLDIRYYWIKQFLDSGILTMRYCKSSEQIADILASVRHGSEFRAMRDQIMGTV